MSRYPNLISESLLISETISFLESIGGSATAVSVVDYVMKISKPEPNLARLLVSDLIDQDPRLSLNDDTVCFTGTDHERIDLAETGDFIARQDVV